MYSFCFIRAQTVLDVGLELLSFGLSHHRSSRAITGCKERAPIGATIPHLPIHYQLFTLWEEQKGIHQTILKRIGIIRYQIRQIS